MLRVKKLKKLVSRLFGKERKRSRLQNFARQQEKFRNAYPNYSLGFASYGFPLVHDDNEGSTLKIGRFCSIAGGCQIFLGKNHRLDWVSTYPFPAFFGEARDISAHTSSKGDVIIGSDVWLCADCIILSGVTIGDGAVVAAGAVVTREVAPYSIVAGNPARHVRWRFDEFTRLALLKARWWDWPEEEIRQIVSLLCSEDINALLSYAEYRS